MVPLDLPPQSPSAPAIATDYENGIQISNLGNALERLVALLGVIFLFSLAAAIAAAAGDPDRGFLIGGGVLAILGLWAAVRFLLSPWSLLLGQDGIRVRYLAWVKPFAWAQVAHLEIANESVLTYHAWFVIPLLKQHVLRVHLAGGRKVTGGLTRQEAAELVRLGTLNIAGSRIPIRMDLEPDERAALAKCRRKALRALGPAPVRVVDQRTPEESQTGRAGRERNSR